MKKNKIDKLTTRKEHEPIFAGIVFVLERFGFNGRRLMFEAFKQVLKKKKLELTPQLFSYSCLNSSIDEALTKIISALSAKKVSADELASNVKKLLFANLKNKAFEPNRALDALLTGAQEKNLVFGALTGLPDDTASAIMTHLKLNERVKLHVMHNGVSGFPAPDSWLELTKNMKLVPQRCVALVTSALACDSALIAGMRCAVIPDEFTSYQDFAGADLIIEGSKEPTVNEILSLLHTCSF